jgi:hypothetical protein
VVRHERRRQKKDLGCGLTRRGQVVIRVQQATPDPTQDHSTTTPAESETFRSIADQATAASVVTALINGHQPH